MRDFLGGFIGQREGGDKSEGKGKLGDLNLASSARRKPQIKEEDQKTTFNGPTMKNVRLRKRHDHQ